MIPGGESSRHKITDFVARYGYMSKQYQLGSRLDTGGNVFLSRFFDRTAANFAVLKSVFTAVLAALLSFGFAASAEAQVNPGSVGPTREEITPPPVDRPEGQPRVRIEGGIERTSCPLADPQYADIRVNIDQVRFNNLKGIDPG